MIQLILAGAITLALAQPASAANTRTPFWPRAAVQPNTTHQPASPQATAAPPAPPAASDAPPTPSSALPVSSSALPAMRFSSTVVADELLSALKANPGLAGLDTELPGSALSLVVTHTIDTTAGGRATTFVSAILSGSSLGLLPVVNHDVLGIRYDVFLNRKVVASYKFERADTRAQILWTAGAAGGALNKDGLDWVRSTATQAAAQLVRDPALLAIRDEMNFYFPPTASSALLGAGGPPP